MLLVYDTTSSVILSSVFCFLIIRRLPMPIRTVTLCPYTPLFLSTKGHCRSALVCPFHGWSYNLDGTLRSPTQPASLPKLDPVEFGLKPVECEIWHGFVFVRFNRSEQIGRASCRERVCQYG